MIHSHMSREQFVSEQARPRRSKAETIIAKGKAIAVVIGALGTAATAIWGAVRTPPETGAKASYEVLKDAIKYERERREEIEDEIAVLKAQITQQQIPLRRFSQVPFAPSVEPSVTASASAPAPGLVPITLPIRKSKAIFADKGGAPALPESTKLF